MPQMKPMNWLNYYLIFYLILMMFIKINYFNIFLKFNLFSKTFKMKKKFKIWKW